MYRAIPLGILASVLGWTSAAQGQVDVRVPLVHVHVGPGVSVQAPFLNLYIGPAGQFVFGPRARPYPPVLAVPPLPPATVLAPPQPLPPPNDPAPAPQAAQPDPSPALAPNRPPTPEEFSRSFQPRAGAYDVTLTNPVTGQPTRVQFTLPDGTPRRVTGNRHELEFSYGLRRFVRIEFDRDGAQVITRQ